MNFGNNRLCYRHAEKIASAIEENTKITNLSIDLCGRKFFVDYEKSNDLLCNDICCKGAKALATAIKKDQTITTLKLNLSLNSIGDEGAKALAEAIKENKTITNLKFHIFDNDIKRQLRFDMLDTIDKSIERNQKPHHDKKLITFLYCCQQNESLNKLSQDVTRYKILPYLSYMDGGPKLKKKMW